MTTTNMLAHPVRRTATAPEAHPAVRARSLQAAVFSVVAGLLAAAVVVAFGKVGLLVAAMALPVPLLLLWASADVTRSDESP